MARRHLAIGSFAAAALAAGALYLVGVGSAGTSNYHFDVFAGPTTLHVGEPGLVFARFQPDASSGSATHTVITFTFPLESADPQGPPTATTSDCVTTQTFDAVTQQQNGWLVTCTVGTVNPGQVVKRFVQYTAASSPTVITADHPDAGVTARVSFDAGTGGKGNGGGAVSGNPVDPGVTIVDGTSADGFCGAGGVIQTAGISTTVTQQTQLSFGAAATQVPCSWGAVSVINGQRGKDGAPMISSVGGPIYAGVANLTLTFASLPVPLNKYVLEENENFDPAHPSQGWSPVPPCSTDPVTGNPTLPQGADACLIGYDKGKPIVAHLLYAGTNGDPWFN